MVIFASFEPSGHALNSMLQMISNGVVHTNQASTIWPLSLRAVFFRSSFFSQPGGSCKKSHRRWFKEPNQWPWLLIMGPLCWEMPLSDSKSASDKMFYALRKLQKRVNFYITFPWPHLDNKEMLSCQKKETGTIVFCLVAKSVLVSPREATWWKCQSLASKRQHTVICALHANTWHFNGIAPAILLRPVFQSRQKTIVPVSFFLRNTHLGRR